MAAKIDENTLAHFNGTERYFRHWTRSIIYTDGIEYLNANGAAWLVDAIASHQHNKKVKMNRFNFGNWLLTTKKRFSPAKVIPTNPQL